MKNVLKKSAACFALLAALAPSVAGAQYVAPPQVQNINPNDLFQDIPSGYPQAPTYFASGSLLSGYFSANGQSDNFLIGGDAGQNLWQRGTTGPSTTGTFLYNADTWFGWSGANTAFTVTRDSTAAALPTGSTFDFRIQRTAAQTGVVPICQSHIVRSLQSTYLAGHTVEFDFNAFTGANFSASAITAYITYGTGTDDGAQKLAFGLNGGGGGSTAWTGQANATAAVISGLAVSTAYRGVAVAAIPATATEVAVSVCYTPTGTAGATDALYLSNLELRKADHLAPFANATAGYLANLTSGAISIAPTLITNGTTPVVGTPSVNAIIPPFSRRQDTVETSLQYGRFYLIPESATTTAQQSTSGVAPTTTTCVIEFPLPAPMWKAPTLLGTSTINAFAALSATTFKVMGGGAAVVLGTPFAAIPTGGSTTTQVAVTFTTSSTFTQYAACQLQSAAGGGAIAFTADE